MRHEIRKGRWFYAKNRQPGSLAAPFLGGRRAGFMYANKDGGPVLRKEASWRNINGLFVNHPRGFITVTFRRFWQ